MSRFIDASALVKRYVAEPESAAVERWLAAGPVAVSRLSEVEIASALARRCREGSLTAGRRDRIVDRMRQDLADAFYVVEVQPPIVAAAIALLAHHPLRTGDALQLASALVLADPAAGSPVELLAYDERLNAAAGAEGLALAAG